MRFGDRRRWEWRRRAPAVCFLFLPGRLFAGGGPEGARAETSGPEHYVYFGLDREEIRKPAFYRLDEVAGAQIAYTWKSLEPEKDRYDFSAVEDDLRFLARHGEKLDLFGNPVGCRTSPAKRSAFCRLQRKLFGN